MQRRRRGTSFAELIDGSASAASHGARRRDIARAHLRQHQDSAEQWRVAKALASQRLVCVPGNRRSGKTSTIGAVIWGRVLTRSNYTARILTHRLSDPAKRWLDHGQDSVVEHIRRMNLGRQIKIDRAPGAIRSIRTAWHSAIYVHEIPHMGSIDAHHGITADDWWADEAQHLHLLAPALQTLVLPTLLDRRGSVFLSGTPGRDIDSAFYGYSQGQHGWHAQPLYAWHNPAFGATVAERWQRLLEAVVLPAAALYRLSDDDIKKLRALTARDLQHIVTGSGPPELAEWVLSLDPHFRRQLLGLWVAGGADYVFAWHDAPADLYFGEEVGSPWHVPGPMVDAPQPCRDLSEDRMRASIRSALDALPRNVLGRDHPWHASIAFDIGWNPSTTAWTVLVWSPQLRGHVYCLHSHSELEVPADLILDRTLLLVDALRFHGVNVVAVRADTNGTLKNLGSTWSSTFGARFGGSIPLYEAEKADKANQIRALDVDILRGNFHVLAGSAIDIEGRHLRFVAHDPDKPKAPKVHKFREVVLPDGRILRPGDHCLDAARYARADCPYVTIPADLKTPPMTTTAILNKRMRDLRIREGFAA